jgi:hypothetical protein
VSSGSQRIGLGFLIAAVVALACAFAWCMHAGTIAIAVGGDETPPARGDAAPAVATARSPAPSGGPDLAAGTALPRTAMARTRVAGEARSGPGEALASWPVRLTSRTPPPLAPGRLDLARSEVRASRFAYTAADGTFAFEDLEPGEYVIDLVEAGAAQMPFELARNEDKWIELRGVGARVEVELVRFGTPVYGRFSIAAGANGANVIYGSTDDRGVGRCLLAPGSYEVRVQNEAWPVGPTSVQTKVVPTGAAATTWRLETGGVDLQVDAAYADGTPCKRFGVRLDGTLATGERAARDFPGVAGTARFPRVPPGRWQVAVQSPDLAPSPPRELTTDNATPSEHLAFVVSAGATVRLSLRDRDGASIDVDAARLPTLVSGDTALRCTTLVAKKYGGPPTQAGYVGVPPGRARLVVEDRVADAGIEFLPFDPRTPIEFDVELGRDNEVVIDVLPRAMVDLRACSEGGREDPTARVSVFACDRFVFGGEQAPGQRWSGWLPPGNYRVIVDRGGDVREHALHVDRAAITMRYRP